MLIVREVVVLREGSAREAFREITTDMAADLWERHVEEVRLQKKQSEQTTPQQLEAHSAQVLAPAADTGEQMGLRF